MWHCSKAGSRHWFCKFDKTYQNTYDMVIAIFENARIDSSSKWVQKSVSLSDSNVHDENFGYRGRRDRFADSQESARASMNKVSLQAARSKRWPLEMLKVRSSVVARLEGRDGGRWKSPATVGRRAGSRWSRRSKTMYQRLWSNRRAGNRWKSESPPATVSRRAGNRRKVLAFTA